MIFLSLRPVDVVWLSGDDRLAFLERMSTNRLLDLAAGEGRATAVLTDSGRVVDLVACYAGADGALLVTSGAGAADVVAAHLRRYILYNDRVRATNAADQVTVLRLWAEGPGDEKTLPHSDDNLAPVLGAATGINVPAELTALWLTGGTEAEPVWVLGHVPHAGLGGADVVVPVAAAADMKQRIEAAAATLGIPLHAATEDDYAAARIGHRLPAFGAEIDGSTNPLELELKDVVDFAKGCYIGQEVVARLDTYDKVQRRLVRREIAGPAAPGDSMAVDGSVTPASMAVDETVANADVTAAGEGAPAVRTRGAARRGRDAGRITTAAPLAGEAGRWQVLALVPAAWMGYGPAKVEGLLKADS